MAQDFYAAFALGEDEQHITAIDAEGVAIVAIQGLSQVVAELKTELQRKEATISNLEEELAEIKSAISLLATQKTTTAR